jgi:hypothetical protein
VNILSRNKQIAVISALTEGCSMNGTAVIGGGSLGNPGPDWTGDYNSDGRSDILWQNSNGAGEMNGTSALASNSLGNPGPTWHV